MKKRILILAILLAVIFIVGCSKAGETKARIPANTNEAESSLKGVSLSPKSFSGNDFTDFFNKAKQAGEIVTWSGDWEQMSDEKSAPYVLAAIAPQYSLKLVIMPQPLGELKQSYKDSAIAFVKKYRPDYIGFGVEVNTMYESSPEKFEDFVKFYDLLYDAVKAESPNTQIFTVFQLERMKGLHGGLFGGINDPEKLSQWKLLDSFSKSDIIAFTTYPGLIYKDPSDIPSDYYSEIKSHTSKPVAFTEIGWFREGSAGWESSEDEQARFISRFFELTKEVKPVMSIWSFMYDPNAEEPFSTMGLLKTEQESSKAFDAWASG